MWYYAIGKETKGPVDGETLRELFNNGTINPKTKVYGESVPQWTALEHTPVAYMVYGGGGPRPGNRMAAGGVMDKILFMKPLVRMLSQGSLLQVTLCWAIRIIAVLLAVLLIVTWVQNWKWISDLDGVGILGGILCQLVLLAGIYACTHVCFIRAAQIKSLSQTAFRVAPMFAIFLRMTGELLATLTLTIGIGTTVLLLFAGDDPRMYMMRRLFSLSFNPMGWVPHRLYGEATSSFVMALINLSTSLAGAFFTLIFFYLLAEAILVIIDIALNVRAIRERSGGPAVQSPADF